ncbi:Coenzyme PQQ synthesis protein D (PqqD) [Hathewaya proteolytica DSM 3090]|uniref:Coenzyme PQQ synthesis protein D (PqqD) n=1 Tax=Hathewaya proteolytica DSM 3090 TaxID=1121331 RepID=A0A1M6RTI7_9CLOT|nr:PqqD family protein [Hathewaya proteolytica]SHK35821.1 Coenzyme PQQ synthesis protein D (PqqD) [Hathewaya proteolytica DSM 3090]
MKNKKIEDNFLKYVPKIKYKNWENHNGIVTLYFFRDSMVEKIVCFLFKKPKITDIKLDKLSSKVWLMINGKDDVWSISEKLCEDTGDSIETSYKRVILFLRYLTRRGWICF